MGVILHDFTAILSKPRCGKSFPNKFHTRKVSLLLDCHCLLCLKYNSPFGRRPQPDHRSHSGSYSSCKVKFARLAGLRGQIALSASCLQVSCNRNILSLTWHGHEQGIPQFALCDQSTFILGTGCGPLCEPHLEV